MSRRTEIIAGAVVFMFLLWSGGYHGWAALIGLAGVGVWFVDVWWFDEEKCWCDNGKVRSWLTRTWRKHRRCGGTGVRRRRSRRVFDRSVK